ncbi:MAG: hypothetical protein CES88_16235 [Halobacteriovorax sp. JY17]|nr:MAG: hypothetical protein CES88_16235 [Halobacteriovorax sp. JY17]
MLVMIYNNSTDPVFIKKISLKIWSLKDEVKAVIQEKMKNSQEDHLTIDELRKEYCSKKEQSAEIIPIKSDEELDTGEDEMAAALAAAESESESEEPSEEIQEAPLEEKIGEYQIIQRSPSLNEEDISSGKTILAEVGMDRIYFFSSKPFLNGQSIVIEFVIPKRFVVNANIVFCREYNMKSRIISKNRLPYRIGAEFSFLKEGERTLLRQFIHSIEPEVKEAPVIETKVKEDEEDFDEFDDLDL